MSCFFSTSIPPFFPITKFGAKIGAGIDCNAAIAASISALGYAFIPPGDFGLDGEILITDDQKLFGIGRSSRLHMLSDAATFFPYGLRPSLHDFSIISALTTSENNAGFIAYDDSTVNLKALEVRNIYCEAPNHERNFISLKSWGTGAATDAVISGCHVETIARMGIEVTSGDVGVGPGPGTTQDLRIVNNTIKGTGNGGFAGGMGISLSGDIDGAIIDHNYFKDNIYTHVELIGNLRSISITGNQFAGTAEKHIVSSGTLQADGVSIRDNSSTPDATGTWDIELAPNTHIHGNNIYCEGLILTSPGIWCTGNRIFINGSGTVGIFIQNTDCVVEDNQVDMTASTSNFSVIRCYGSAATRNVIRNNILGNGGHGGNLFDEVSGAQYNIFDNNREYRAWYHSIPGPSTHRVTSSAADNVRTINFADAQFNSTWQAFTARVRLTGVETAGTNAFYSEHLIKVRASVGNTPVLIDNFTVREGGVTLAVTFSTDVMTITATVSAGTPNYVWDVEVTNPLGPGIGLVS